MILGDIYMQVINGATTRPLDYDYLKQLPPASQRFYELLSYPMYGALKHGRPRARLTYSECCTYAPQTRYFDWERVRKQMAKVHAPHKQSGYILEVEFEQTSDKEDRPDWLMTYTPGPKAKAEYQAFTKRGGPVVLEIKPPPANPVPMSEPPAPTELERELIRRGVTARTAAELVRSYPTERIGAQVEQLDWICERHPKKIADPGAYLADAIRNDYAAPKGFESPAERARREASERERRRRDVEQRRGLAEAKAREREAQGAIAAYLASLSKYALADLDREALEQCDGETRASYEATTLPSLKRSQLRLIREAHVRGLLKLSPAPEAAR
jgi:hypothetical protein